MARPKKPVSLRRQLYDARRQYIERKVAEQAFDLARGAQLIEVNFKGLFKHLNYDEIMSVGITRKDSKGRTVHITGEEAVKIQIMSLKARGNKSTQAERFKDNYLRSMREVGFNSTEIYEARQLLDSISIDALTLLYKEGRIKSIEFTYNNESKKDTLESLRNAVKTLDKKRVKELRERAKVYKPLLREIARQR